MKKSFCVVVLLPFFISSCLVFHKGSVAGGPLLDKSDTYVDISQGKAKSVFVLGIGNPMNEDLVLKAKNQMYTTRPLQANEYYSNISTSITDKYILLFIHQTKVSVSADVMRSGDVSNMPFTKEFTRLAGSETYRQKKNLLTVKDNYLIPGDTVYYSLDSKQYKLYVIDSISNGIVTLDARKEGDRTKVKLKNSEFFVRNMTVNGYKSGDAAKIEFTNEQLNLVTEEAKVMGLTFEKVLIKTKDRIYVVPFRKLKSKTK